MNHLIKIFVISLFCMTSLHAQTATRVIFENNFGNPPTNPSNPTDNSGIRKRWDLMPTDVNTFVFASENAPNIENKGYSEAKAIENNFYAVVGPKYIYSSVGLTPGNMQGVWEIWTKLKNGDATPGHNGNGGALVINAGTTLSSFNIGIADLKPGRYYKLTYKLFIENGLVRLKQNVISPSGNTKLVSVTGPDNGQTAAIGQWTTQSYWFYLASTCAEENYAIALENANADNYGNDYAIDDIKFEEFSSPPSDSSFSTINCNAAEPIANDDQSLLNAKGSSPMINVYNNDFLANNTTKPTQSNATFIPLVPIGGYNTPYTNNQITVKGEGIWTYSSNGDVRFTPANGFTGNPTPLSYRFTDNSTKGSSNIAKIVITYAGNLTAHPDNVNANEGDITNINILANDTDTNGAVIDKGIVNSIYLINPFSLAENTSSITINGEGVWSIDSTTKNLIFTPESTFKNSPTPIQYYFTDVNGNKSNKETVTINVSKAEPQVTCTKNANPQASSFETTVGISTKSTHPTKWPNSIPNGFLALESSEKGFVITRVTNSNQISDAKEGMLVYDKTDRCVKLYNGSTWKCIERSCNN